MPSYTTANLSFNAPITFEKQSLNLRVDRMNIGNARYNEYEYISSGGYFASLAPDPNHPPNGYINAYPGAPRTIYGTLSYLAPPVRHRTLRGPMHRTSPSSSVAATRR
jgi:iron complex outermembrane receptor protein